MERFAISREVLDLLMRAHGLRTVEDFLDHFCNEAQITECILHGPLRGLGNLQAQS